VPVRQLGRVRFAYRGIELVGEHAQRISLPRPPRRAFDGKAGRRRHPAVRPSLVDELLRSHGHIDHEFGQQLISCGLGRVHDCVDFLRGVRRLQPDITQHVRHCQRGEGRDVRAPSQPAHGKVIAPQGETRLSGDLDRGEPRDVLCSLGVVAEDRSWAGGPHGATAGESLDSGGAIPYEFVLLFTALVEHQSTGRSAGPQRAEASGEGARLARGALHVMVRRERKDHFGDVPGRGVRVRQP
jgi:hypothetical protein